MKTVRIAIAAGLLSACQGPAGPPGPPGPPGTSGEVADAGASGPDTSVATVDASVDANGDGAVVADANVDASVDAEGDANVDASVDAQGDANVGETVDTGIDAPQEAMSLGQVGQSCGLGAPGCAPGLVCDGTISNTRGCSSPTTYGCPGSNQDHAPSALVPFSAGWCATPQVNAVYCDGEAYTCGPGDYCETDHTLTVGPQSPETLLQGFPSGTGICMPNCVDGAIVETDPCTGFLLTDCGSSFQATASCVNGQLGPWSACTLPPGCVCANSDLSNVHLVCP